MTPSSHRAQAPRGSRLTLRIPEAGAKAGRFDLTRAVCDYGFFILAPTRWDAPSRCLSLPLRGQDDRIIQVRVRQGDQSDGLVVQCDDRVSTSEAVKIRAALSRMLRLGEDFTHWFKVHAPARREGFARMFRGARLFEDVVKTMTTCNVAWGNTVRMNALLCEKIGQGAFPTPAQVARCKPATLKAKCRVGYRGPWMIELARKIERGELDESWFEDPSRTTDELYEALRGILGVGEYAAHNMLQLLGHYDRLPVDSETVRHVREVHGMTLSGSAKERRAAVRGLYERYAPYQFLAYWYELKQGYEVKAGPAESWQDADTSLFSSRSTGRSGGRSRGR